MPEIDPSATSVHAESVHAAPRRRRIRFSLRALSLFIFILCLGLSALKMYGLDIVVPITTILGTGLGILVSRRWALLSGPMSGGVGASIGGFIIGSYAYSAWSAWWASTISKILFLPGLAVGLIVTCVAVGAGRLWEASDRLGKRVLATLGVLAIFAGAIWIPWPYREQAYIGDGSITDHGFWSYYRYFVRFPTISLSEPCEYTFHCTSLPPYPLYFGLTIREMDSLNTGGLAAFSTIADVRLIRSDGSTVAHASDPLSKWVLMQSASQYEYWHRSLASVKVDRNASYRLIIRIHDVDPKSAQLLVEPVLGGGGNELP
jgi:hypothetical protein